MVSDENIMCRAEVLWGKHITYGSLICKRILSSFQSNPLSSFHCYKVGDYGKAGLSFFELWRWTDRHIRTYKHTHIPVEITQATPFISMPQKMGSRGGGKRVGLIPHLILAPRPCPLSLSLFFITSSTVESHM